MTSTLCCAYLRVYRPLDALPEGPRTMLERALADPGEHGEVRGRGLGLIAPAERREVFERVVGGRRYVCPAETRLRTLLGLVTFEQALPEGIGEVFFSAEEVEAARRELTQMQASRGDLRSPVLQSPWYVPLQWFACFTDEERRIEHDGEHPRVRYETVLERAQERVGRALGILHQASVHPTVLATVQELQEWLGGFQAPALVELDYASVARLFDENDLADDHTASDVWSALEALEAGDALGAGLHYRRAGERWVVLRNRRSMN